LDAVLQYLDTDITRPYVDLNRAVDDLPPENPDGVVKLKLFFRCRCIRMDFSLIRILLRKYCRNIIIPF